MKKTSKSTRAKNQSAEPTSTKRRTASLPAATTGVRAGLQSKTTSSSDTVYTGD